MSDYLTISADMERSRYRFDIVSHPVGDRTYFSPLSRSQGKCSVMT